MSKKKNNKSDRVFDTPFWIISIIAFLLFCTLFFLPYLFTLGGKESLDFTQTGQIGDTIGGTMSPFVAIIAAALTFLAFWVQYKANILQRNDIALERFENNLFQLISQQENITNSLTFSEGVGIDDKSAICGRYIFYYIYNARKMGWHSGLKHTLEEDGIEKIDNDISLRNLDHYFRHLYQILKYIDEAPVLKDNDRKKYEYASIVRASLSEYELILLFYIAQRFHQDDDLKGLIEKYAIFKYIHINNLATEKEKNYYANIIKGINIDESSKIPFPNYSVNAFVYKNS